MTPAEKAASLAVAASTLVGRSYVRGSLRITVIAPPQVDDAGRLVVWVSATRNGVDLPLDLPFIYVNPPLGIRLADDTVKVDHMAALKDMVAATVDRF